MNVRAKFRVQRKTETPGSRGDSQFEIELQPVTSGSEENERFFKYTPGGEIKLAVVNDRAAEALEVGKEYYVDFTPVG